MSLMRLKIFCLALLATSSTAYGVAPYFSIRSQSVDAARELMGWAHKVNLFDMEKIYGTFAITIEGTGSFKPNKISESLFGIGNDCFSSVTTVTCCNNECCDGAQVTISGSQVSNRGANDWMADYFGLDPLYQSVLSFKPRVNNFIADFNLYVGLDEWLCGTYFRIHAPVVWTKWNLHACESIVTTTTLIGYQQGYFGPNAVPSSALNPSALAFFENGGVPTIGGGVTFQPLQYATFKPNGESKVALAEIQMALGWNFFMEEDYHLGLNFRFYAPTGNRPEGIYLFEPIVGNGKHWEVGVGLTSHYTFWNSPDEDCSFGVYVDANFTSLLRTRQTRTFDLTGRPLSRYMLAEKMGTPVTNLYANANANTSSGSTAPSEQFINIFSPVANLTTVDVKVRSAIQADVVAMFNYTNCNLEFDFGYNFWARTCEHIDLDCNCCPTPLADGTTWALKGDAFVTGFAQSSAGGVVANQAINLSASESNATINAGTNYPSGSAGLIPARNPNVDNALYATFATSGVGANILYQPSGSAGDQTKTSLNPILLNETYIALQAARTQGMSQKVFAHVSYTWRDNECWMPYLGVGGKAEFASKQKEGSCGSNNVNCNPLATGGLPQCTEGTDNDCGSCQRCNLSEWGVWLKGGISFN